MHRIRIIEYRVRYVCRSPKRPSSLVLLAAPDGSDCDFFLREVKARKELAGTRLVAVNDKTIRQGSEGDDDGDVNISYVEHTTLEQLLTESPTAEVTHAWLDTTSKEIDNELLWNARRVTTANIYLVVVLQRQQRSDAEMVLRIQCEFFGLQITHQEA
mgnify:CR=1 FL=1